MRPHNPTILSALCSGLVVFVLTSWYYRNQCVPTAPATFVPAQQSVPQRQFVCPSVPKAKKATRELRSLNDVWTNRKGYISVKWANYLWAYEEEFSRIRAAKRHVVLLEIGVGTGGSLQLWREYFGPESEIIGVDINPKTCSELTYGEGITVHCMDVTNSADVLKLFGLYQFDIIIDDAGHSSADLITTFSTLFPKLRPGGVFAMEDVASVYGSEGLKKKNTSFIEFMKDFVDMTNMWEIFWLSHGLPASVTPFQKEVGMWIHSISFQENMVIVRKLPFSKSASFDVLRSGQDFVVGPGNPANYFNTILRQKPMQQRLVGLNVRVP